MGARGYVDLSEHHSNSIAWSERFMMLLLEPQPFENYISMSLNFPLLSFQSYEKLLMSDAAAVFVAKTTFLFNFHTTQYFIIGV